MPCQSVRVACSRHVYDLAEGGVGVGEAISMWATEAGEMEVIEQVQAGEVEAADLGRIREEKERGAEMYEYVAIPSRACLQVQLDESCRWRRRARRTDLRSQSDESIAAQQ